jgi:competence protein ComEC
MLVDTGPAPERLAACLARVGVEHIDLLVLTHFDLDHVGGAAAVTGMVGTVVHGPAYGDGDRILTGFRSGGARVIQAHAGITGSVGRADWRVLWPRLQSRGFPFGNDASVIVDVRGGGVPPTLLLGDLSASPQRALAASAVLRPPYTVVKVAHHGSADQDPALYRQVAPVVALVTVGLDNDYGHPREETLEILGELGARVMRTDLDGVVAVSPAAGGWELWREHGSRVGAGG